MLKFTKILSTIFLCSACIQIPLGSKKTESYKKVKYSQPNPGFLETTDFGADRTWINKESGSIISYKSECTSNLENTELFLQKIKNELYPTKTFKLITFKYNSRKALRQKIQTEIEGIPTLFDLIILKKYGCLFLISHSGVLKNFLKTENTFEQFLASFKIKR